MTVVLVGTATWQRKHVDWEIASSLRDAPLNPRSGLVGIILPSYQALHPPGTYDVQTIPARLADNIACGYAKLYGWTENAEEIAEVIHEAYLARRTKKPDHSRLLMRRNSAGQRWW